MRSSVNMQTYTWALPVRQNSFPGPHQTLSDMGFQPMQQMGFSNPQQTIVNQQSARFSDPQAFPQRAAYFPSNLTRLTRAGQYYRQSHFEKPPKVVIHYNSLQTGQVTESSEQQVFNPPPSQRNHNDLHCKQNISSTAPVSALPGQNCASVKSCMYDSNPSCQHPLNGQHQIIQATHPVAAQSQHAPVTSQMQHPALTTSTNHGQMSGIEHQRDSQFKAFFLAASRMLEDSSPNSWVGTSGSQSQVSSQIVQQLHTARADPPTQKLTNQRLKQYLGQKTSQNTSQSQNTPHSMEDVSASQSSRQPQVLQSSNPIGLPPPERLTSCRTTKSQISDTLNSTNSSRILLTLLLQKNNDELPALTSSISGFDSQFVKSISGSQQPAQDCTSGCSANGLNDTQYTKSWQSKEPQKPAEETGVSMGSETSSDGPLAEPYQTSQNVTTIWKRRDQQLQMVQKANKAVAVVPPISQQYFSQQQNEHRTNPPDSVPLKLDTAEKTETNVTFKLNEDLPQVLLFPRSENAASESSQCGNNFASTFQTTPTCLDMTSNSSVEKNHDQRPESSTEDTLCDLSTVPAVDYTLKDLRNLVKHLEVSPADKSTAPDVMKCIIQMFYVGGRQNIKHIKAFREILKTASESAIQESHAVVLRNLRPKHFAALQRSFQILNNESTFQSGEFRSSWLNVDGHADVERVLAEPISDYITTWREKVSQSASENVENVVDSSGQIGADNARDLVVLAPKEVLKATSDNISEDICPIEPEVSLSEMVERTLESGCISGASDQFSTMKRHSKTPFSESSDTSKTDNSDEFEEESNPERSDYIGELMILSAEDARKIFNECFELDQKIEPQPTPQEERKDPGTPRVRNPSGKCKVKTLNDLKFTCPHMSGSVSDNDFFCPACWDKTPLFVIDQDEVLLSPEDLEPKTDSSGSSDGPEDPNEAECSSPTPARAPKPGSTDPAAEDLQETTSSPGTQKKEDADFQLGTKILSGTASPSSSSCKNIQSPKTDADPDGFHFSADIVLEHNCTPKHHPREHMSKSCDGDQVRDGNTSHCHLPYKTKAPSQTPNIISNPEDKNAARHKQKRPRGKDKGSDGQSTETKKLRLELYGSNRSTSSCQDKVKSTPKFVTICPNSDSGESYTDKPLAKKKVYKQWISTFVQPQNNSSKNFLKKKSHKRVKDCLKLKIQQLKISLRDRPRS